MSTSARIHPELWSGSLSSYAVLVVVHLVSNAVMEQPLILADELGYLGNARYLAGAAPLPNMHGSQFYHFGYSLLLLPAFWVFTEPAANYTAVLVTNALLMSALYFPLRYLLATFQDLSPEHSGWIAFACCLYPALVLHSSIAWTENAFIPFYVLAVALFGHYLYVRSTLAMVAFALTTAFLYTVHPRALPVVAGALGYVALLTLIGGVPKRHLGVGATLMAVVVAATRSVNAHLRALGWGGGGEISATKLAGRLVPGSDFDLLVERVVGQLLYLSLASHGLFLIGVGVTTWIVVRAVASTSLKNTLAQPRTGVSIFALGSATGIFIASCTAKLYSVHGPDGVRGEVFIHGRYNEAACVLFTAVALAWYFRHRPTWRQLVAIPALTLVLTVVTATEVDEALVRHDPSVPAESVPDLLVPAEVPAVAVPAVFPLISHLGGLRLYAMFLAAMGAFAIVTFAIRLHRRAGLAVVTLLFVAYGVDNHERYLRPAVDAAGPRLEFVDRMSAVGPIDTLSYDATFNEPELFYGAQALMPRTRFERFDSGRRERPTSEAVISSNRWRQARRLEATFVVSSGWNNALWLLPGELAARMPAVDYDGVVLGVEPRFGFQESGFHLPETYRGAPGRWTDGAATVKVPLADRSPPRFVGVETLTPGRDGAEVNLLANGTSLWRGRIPPHAWSRTFDVTGTDFGKDLVLELESDTFTGKRRLGVMVRGIQVLPTAIDYDGVLLGAAPVIGFDELGFYAPEVIDGAPGRWTSARASLTVPFEPEHRPASVDLELLAPGRDRAPVRVSINGVEVSSLSVSPAPAALSVDLGDVVIEAELVITVESDTFIPARVHPGSTDTRELGVVVRSIRVRR